jgi:hypothetical protein
MDTTDNSSTTGAVGGFFRDAFRTGMGAAENIQVAAAEIPLTILSGLGMSEDTTRAAREKHREMVRGLYGTIDSIASQVATVGAKQVSLLSNAICEATRTKQAS